MAMREQAAQIQPENVLSRVARIPLIHSAFQITSFAYQDIKNINPLLGYFFNVSERGVKTATQLATTSLGPVLRVVEPQIAVVNQAALWMVDELEVRVPVLDQPADEIVSVVTNSLAGSVRGLRDRALNRLQNGLDRVRAVVKDAQDVASLAAVTMGSRGLKELLSLGSELALSGAENLLAHYLPEEGDGEQESISSEETEDTQSSALGLASRTSCLINTIIVRLMGKLNPYLDTTWDLLHGGVNFVLSLPSKIRKRIETVMRNLFFLDDSKEDSKRKTDPKMNKLDTTPKVTRSVNRKRTFSEPIQYGYFRSMLFHRTSASVRRRSSEKSQERLQTHGRRQSLDSSCHKDPFAEE
ncbi:Hypothetical predicted protein [Pelobates cultripes]|uniref:Uncharacterized protein n=2 Tax=Pelobates cultripes TaxID=61616 RepID=A0AAD1WSS0_PELCU|nr:Hypothetical predicted protein [Pelobates cultripes]